MGRLVVILTAALALTGCKEFNPEACENPANQNDPRCTVDAAPVMCDTTCPGTDVCLNHVCVRCTAAQHDACTGMTPACDDTTHTCVGCSSHDQCNASSDVCAPEGNCADTQTVAYIAVGGDDANTCTKDQKCKTMTRALAQGRTYIKVEDQANDNKTTLISDQAVTILAEPNAAMHNSSQGPILQIMQTGTKLVRIFDLTLENAIGGTVPFGNAITMTGGNLELVRVSALNNQSSGIVVTNAAKLTMNRCVLVRNSTLVGDGGVSAFNVDYDITNSIFAVNGAAVSPSGAAFLRPNSAAASKFEFNTIANNVATTGAPAVNCSGSVPTANNIVFNTIIDLGATCTSTFSLFKTGPPNGNGNLAGTPDFKSIDFTNPHAVDFYRLNNNSLGKDGADPFTTMKVDIDGDHRPQGTQPDIGADEIKMQ